MVAGPSPKVPVLEPGAFRGTELDRRGTWVVEFLADWCGFCRRFAPKFAELSGEGFELACADVTSEASPLWDDFRIQVVPTVIVFRNGRATFRADGRYLGGLNDRDLEAIRHAARGPDGPAA